MREVSIQGLKQIGMGTTAKIYEYDENKVIKVFYQGTSYDTVWNEYVCNKAAYDCGVPIVEPYEVVSTGESYGIILEYIHSDTLQKILQDHPEDYEKYLKLYIDLVLGLREYTPDQNILRPVTDTLRASLLQYGNYMKKADLDRYLTAVSSYPKGTGFVHGDCHMKNVMLRDGELVLIDATTAGTGDPLLELCNLHFEYIHAMKKWRMIAENLVGTSVKDSQRIWDAVFEAYVDRYQITDRKALLRTCEKYSEIRFGIGEGMMNSWMKQPHHMDNKAKPVKHIIYSADHKFMLYTSVSIHSLVKNWKSDEEIYIHLLTDETFQPEDRNYLERLAEQYPNMKYKIHVIEEEVMNNIVLLGGTWSKATYYRLFLPELLPEIDECLYVDSDTLVLDDVSDVWNTDMKDMYLAGVLQCGMDGQDIGIKDELPSFDTYINAGIILMNLKLMRENDLIAAFKKKIPNEYILLDQDILNICCYGHIRLISEKYNCMLGIQCEHPAIYHYNVYNQLRPWVNSRGKYALLWWEFADLFDGIVDIQEKRNKADEWFADGSLTCLFRLCSEYDEVYIYGDSLDAKRLQQAFRRGKCKNLKGFVKDNIVFCGQTLIINMAKKKEDDVRRELNIENDSRIHIVSFTKRAKFFYRNLQAQYQNEIYEELLMWDFGVDIEGLPSLPAMLEVRAVQYPDKVVPFMQNADEAWQVTYLEFNKKVNRVANGIISQNLKRGSKIEVGSVCSIEELIYVLGVLKSGMTAVFGNPIRANSFDAYTTYPDTKSAIECHPEEAAVQLDGCDYTHKQLTELVLGAEGKRSCLSESTGRILNILRILINS